LQTVASQATALNSRTPHLPKLSAAILIAMGVGFMAGIL
jgi:hypothetical protein